jgi:hypothetical protein
MTGMPLFSADTPVPKDVVIAIAGAAAVLGGLVLVFLGVVVTSLQDFGGETDGNVLTPYKWAAGAILSVFALSLASATLAITWLATGGGGGFLYHATLWTFFGLLLAVLILALGIVYLIVFD